MTGLTLVTEQQDASILRVVGVANAVAPRLGDAPDPDASSCIAN